MAPKASKHKAANGYTLPDKIPEGTILTTITKKKFRLGKSIGIGGFGEIYLCSDDVSRPVGDDALKAVKIEPHSNGPLFVEMNFYIRAALPDSVDEFMQNKGISSLGMPCYRGSGSHMIQDEKYRFLVMDRFGNDLQKIFQSGQKLFSSKVSYNLALKILDVLEYIHSKGYVHNDIKAQNLLLGYGRTKENDIYLVDFGLVSKYHRDGVHLEYKPDARKAHDGTIEYTSRDAHIGAHSRRSDLEILGYNLVHWMSGHLPWMDNLSNAEYVEAQKKGFMSDVRSFLQRCFGDRDVPEVLLDFLEYTNSLEFDSAPDYDHCRTMFKDALTDAKHPLDGKIDFTTPKTPLKLKKKKKRKQSGADEPDGKKSRTTPHQPTPSASPSPDINDFGALTRSGGNSEDMDNWSWERVLCSDPEMLIRQASRQSEADDESPLAMQHRALEEKKQAESLLNPTPVMLEVLQRMEDREKERENMTWQQQLQHLTGRKLNPARVSSWDLTPNPLTPAMEEVIKMRSKRISVEIDIPITPEPSGSGDSDDDTSSHEEYVPPSASKKKTSPLMTSQKNFNVSTEDLTTSSATSTASNFRRRLIIPQLVSSSTPESVDNSPKRKEVETLMSDDDDDEVSVNTVQRRQLDAIATQPGPKGRPTTSSTATDKRRGSVPHVVRVQSLPYSPDRIRNKGSPVKVTPVAESAAHKMDLSERLINSMSAEETRSQIAELNRFANKRRRISILNNEARTNQTAVTIDKKAKKRKLEENLLENDDVVITQKSGLKKAKKSPTIETPEEELVEEKTVAKCVLKKKGKMKQGPRLASSPQRLSSIPVEVCIETLGTTQVKPRGRPSKKQKLLPVEEEEPTPCSSLAVTRKKKLSKKTKKDQMVELESEDEVALTVRGGKLELEPEAQVGSKKSRSTRSSGARSTRSKDWSWEKVLLTNPDKMSRNKK